ncbi:MAG: OmpA family protein [Bacteroidales bacterium]|nr:OmpA family protein [Bacteroidales bacterium]
MHRIKDILFSILTIAAILVLTAVSAYSQKDNEIVSFFVRPQLEVKDNQTVFNVFRVENRTDYTQRVQINFTIPVDWIMFTDRTYYLNLEPHKDASIPIRIAPAATAKGGVGYALNAALLTMDGENFASKYCFLTVPIKTSFDIKFSNISYYLDHRYGRVNTALKIKNNGNSNQMLGIKLYCDEHIDFSEVGQQTYQTSLSLPAGKDTTIRAQLRYNDMVENINYFNKTLIADIAAHDSVITKYAFVRYLDYKYENYIDDADQPLVVELSALDMLSDVISFRLMVMGKLKFTNHRSLSYYYRSISAPLKDLPSYKYDEYFVRYQTPKQEIEVGNIRDSYALSTFGLGAKYRQNITPKTYFKIGAIDDIYSKNYALSGEVGTSIRRTNLSAFYLKMISDTSYNPYLDMAGGRASFTSNIIGNINLYGHVNQYNQPELSDKTGYSVEASLSRQIRNLRAYIHYRSSNPYDASYYRGREALNTIFQLNINKRGYWQAHFNRYKYTPTSIYNNYSTSLNYHYYSIRLLYNYILSKNSLIYFGPNYDYGVSNYWGSQKVKELKLTSTKAEIGYQYSPNLYALKTLSLNMQVGQTNTLQYCDSLTSQYTGKNPVLKFSAMVQGSRWGAYAMYYSGLYNMSMALSNFYTGTAGKYMYLMPYFRITSANKRFYYEVRFSYLNNIDLKNTRTAIIQEGGADLGNGWSMRIINNTNIQALQDATGQSYRYTNNYMEFTVRKVFKWSQPGQKYHTLRTVFYRDLNDDRIFNNKTEPGVENVIVGIQNNSTIDTSYHFNGEMFGNVDLASNYNGYTIYQNIPEAEYHLTFDPTTDENDNFTIMERKKTINLTNDTVIYVPFVERNIVFGVVKFTKSQRSHLQDIKLDGIKICLTDNSNGRVYYALTDQNGYYEIYAPSANFYTVQIANNSWSETFELKQDKYIIKFNGYKRFEVNFEFEERKRVIKFDDEDINENITIDDLVDGENKNEFKYEGVTQIKQTILRGSVTDEKTLMPLVATVEVVDLMRHDVVAKLKTSQNNGSFYTNFITGNNYQLKVHAPGYWVHQEALANDQLSTFEHIERDGLVLKRIEVGKTIETRNLTFAENEANLSPEAKAELNNMVILLSNNEGVSIKVVGKAENSEKQPYELANKRAKAIMEFMLFRGISVSRIKSEAEVGNRNQRKAELVITDSKE